MALKLGQDNNLGNALQVPFVRQLGLPLASVLSDSNHMLGGFVEKGTWSGGISASLLIAETTKLLQVGLTQTYRV